MALTDENGGSPFTMPVAPMYGNNGFSGFGGDGGWWIVLLLLALGGGWGMNGWGMGGMMGGFGGMWEFPWLLNGQNNINANTNAGFDHAATQAALGDLSTAVTSGFGNVQNALCSGFAGVNAGIANSAAQAEISANARQMANMQQLFGIQSAQQECCCENRASIADLKYTVATEACADRAAVNDALRDVIAANTASTQRILDQLCADKIEAKNDTIAQLRSELLYARGQASQDVQTAAIQAGQRALANEVEQYVNPTPRPAYIVQNPNCCYNGCGCGVA